jgi:hypothetical protein
MVDSGNLTPIPVDSVKYPDSCKTSDRVKLQNNPLSIYTNDLSRLFTISQF